MKTTINYILTFVFLFTTSISTAQYTTKRISKAMQAYTDSLKSSDYDYIFPILGKKAIKRGFDIPYPVGIMTNYFWTNQGLAIENLALGLRNAANIQDIPLTEVGFIEFGDNRVEAYNINVRPDIWIFPFLNIYGIFGYGQSTTDVNVVEPISINSVVTQDIATAGFGVTGAFGLGPVWMALDGNWTWTNPALVKEPVRVSNFGVRLGQSYAFPKKPFKNVAFWIGGMRLRMDERTEGAITMREALGDDFFDRAQNIVNAYDFWRQFQDPNTPGLGVTDQIIDAMRDFDGEAIIEYGLDKRPTQEWNMVIGGQYQINKTWIVRSEVGLLGDRQSFLLSLNYRFRL